MHLEIKKHTTMARPIATTPTLKGLEALRFMEKMENVKPISQERKEEMRKNYELFKSKATFPV